MEKGMWPLSMRGCVLTRTCSAIAVLLTFVFPLLMSLSEVLPPGEIPEIEPGTLRVMSYNILNAGSQSARRTWETRGKRVCELIRQFNPDIFGVQEAYPWQTDDILSALPRYASLGEGRRGVRQDENCDIFYRRDRFRPLKCGTFWLSETPEKPASQSWGSSLPRIVTWAVLFDKQAQKPFLYCNTHFDHPSSAQLVRLNSAIVTWKFIKERFPDLPVVLTGDLNCSPSEQAMQFFTGKLSTQGLTADLTDTYAALGGPEPSSDNGITTYHGFSATPPARRIDYVLIRGKIKPLRAGILINKIEEAFPSDHHPVWAELRFE
jgi:endonuclease/exonuclease/phosphatase family metal-dependent hydrolase